MSIIIPLVSWSVSNYVSTAVQNSPVRLGAPAPLTPALPGYTQDRWASLIVTWLAGHAVWSLMSPATLCIGKLFVTAPMPWVLFVVTVPMLFQFITSYRLTVLVCELKLMPRNACSSLFIRNPSRLFALSGLYWNHAALLLAQKHWYLNGGQDSSRSLCHSWWMGDLEEILPKRHQIRWVLE